MKTTRIQLRSRPNNTANAAFTLIELAVTLAVLGVLSFLLAASVLRNSSQVKRAQCIGNLRQFAMATHIYATENRGRLPETVGPAAWVWDLPNAAADALLVNGMEKKAFYCPGTSPRFDDKLNYLNTAPNSLWSFSASFHVIGYAAAFNGSTLVLSNQNTTIFPEQTKVNPSTYLPAPPDSERPLLADATISENLSGTPANPAPAGSFANVPGGFMSGSLPHLSPHLNGTLPAGGNIAFKDGHVQWRKFAEMSQRASSGRGFWW